MKKKAQVSRQYSTLATIPAAPVFAWELSLALYLIIKGFKPSPITAGNIPSSEPNEGPPRG